MLIGMVECPIQSSVGGSERQRRHIHQERMGLNGMHKEPHKATCVTDKHQEVAIVWRIYLRSDSATSIDKKHKIPTDIQCKRGSRRDIVSLDH
jgi:hypothetical protein